MNPMSWSKLQQQPEGLLAPALQPGIESVRKSAKGPIPEDRLKVMARGRKASE